MTDTPKCHVCGNPLDTTDVATCSVCDRSFHLRLRNDSPGTDCGDAAINEQYMALEFTCFVCLGRGQEPAVGSAH